MTNSLVHAPITQRRFARAAAGAVLLVRRATDSLSHDDGGQLAAKKAGGAAAGAVGAVSVERGGALAALEFCHEHGIGCFRVNSRILPVKTHPVVGYEVSDLPEAEAILAGFRRCGQFATTHGVRVCFHPDQFVVLNSPRADVVASSIAELEYQAEVAEWVAADVINVHAGGAYGQKAASLARSSAGLTDCRTTCGGG